MEVKDEFKAILALSHRIDDAAQGITESKAYAFATELRILLGVDGEEERLRLEWALGDYANGEDGCPHCGRHRLCICPNGKHRCEKCNWSPEMNGYAPVND